jgi:hypothetical protein
MVTCRVLLIIAAGLCVSGREWWEGSKAIEVTDTSFATVIG